MSWKSLPFSHSKRFPFTESLRTALKSLSFSQPKHRSFEQFFTFCKSRLFYLQKLLLYVPFFAVRKKFPFSQTKSLSFAQTFTNCPQKPPFLRTKSFFCTNLYELSSKIAFYVQKIFYSHKLSLFPPKITLFCPPQPIPTTLNLLFAKNTAVLLMFA